MVASARIRLGILVAAALPAAGSAFAGDYWSDYANAWLGDQLRRERPDRFWSDLVVRRPKSFDQPADGARTWVPRDENPWANAFGKPAESAWRVTTLPPPGREIMRVCSCYLPADARSWDGGPLTEADIARLCSAQCF
jgi:hypothetical protein